MVTSDCVGAQPVCMSVPQAGVDLKQLQVEALFKCLSRTREESNSSLLPQI